MAETFNPFSLIGKTILVTGASSGIGRGIAIACSRMGATLYINGRNEERLKDTLSALEGSGHSVAVGDLSVASDVEQIVEQVPSLDGIVHCAGIGERTLCKNIGQADIDIQYMRPGLLLGDAFTKHITDVVVG